MNKLKNKLKLLKILIPLLLGIIRFRVKVFWHKFFNGTNKSRKIDFFAIGAIIVFVLLYFLFLSAPADFPAGAIIRIEPGMSLRAVSLKLKGEHIISSQLAFEAFVILNGGENHIRHSPYFFETKISVAEVARRLVRGEHHLPTAPVTIPEGFDNSEIAEALAKKLSNFDKSEFLKEAAPLQGYLFPDTYFFFTTDTETDVLRSMSQNFEKKIAPFRPVMIEIGKTLAPRSSGTVGEKEIIIMASLIEGEAKGDEDRALISGILWKRISIGMPLQADASPETYKSRGLPKNPIGNPGLEAIKAALYPKSSPYLYYLHDKNGIIHYARNFSEHNSNIQKYLK